MPHAAEEVETLQGPCQSELRAVFFPNPKSGHQYGPEHNTPAILLRKRKVSYLKAPIHPIQCPLSSCGQSLVFQREVCMCGSGGQKNYFADSDLSPCGGKIRFNLCCALSEHLSAGALHHSAH